MLAAIRRASSLALWPECRLDLETMHRRQRNCARLPKRFRQSRIDRYAPQRGNGRAVLFHRRISEGEEDKGFLETPYLGYFPITLARSPRRRSPCAESATRSPTFARPICRVRFGADAPSRDALSFASRNLTLLRGYCRLSSNPRFRLRQKPYARIVLLRRFPRHKARGRCA